jgi:hypothetical protein
MELKYFVDKGDYKEIIRNDKSLFKCPFCGEWFKALAYHTNQKEGVKGKTLRHMMGLKSNYQLTTPQIKQRHKDIVLQNKQSHINKNLLIKGKKTRYKKGTPGHKKKNWSNQAINELKNRNKKKLEGDHYGKQQPNN